MLLRIDAILHSLPPFVCTHGAAGVGIKAPSLRGVYEPKLLVNGTSSDFSRYARVRFCACAVAAMPTPQPEIYHSPNARFQSGNRVYRIVILGQGGVGKSGERRGSGVCRLTLNFFPGLVSLQAGACTLSVENPSYCFALRGC